MEQQTLKELITLRYGNVDTFIRETKCSIGREHLYRIIHHQSPNVTAIKINELRRCLNVSGDYILDELVGGIPCGD